MTGDDFDDDDELLCLSMTWVAGCTREHFHGKRHQIRLAEICSADRACHDRVHGAGELRRCRPIASVKDPRTCHRCNRDPNDHAPPSIDNTSILL